MEHLKWKQLPVLQNINKVDAVEITFSLHLFEKQSLHVYKREKKMSHRSLSGTVIGIRQVLYESDLLSWSVNLLANHDFLSLSSV